MTGIELACAAVIALYLVARLAREPRRGRVLARLLLLAAAGALGETGCIRLYGFYHYAPAHWSLFLDQVPLLVALTWPVVIHSAWELAARLRPGAEPEGRVLLAGGVVLADAALIEPVAVQAGLWSWTVPGPFAVPPVGVLGWGIFALCALALLEWRPLTLARGVALALLPPLLVHLGLLAAWWGAFRWLSGPWPELPLVILAWTGALASTWRGWRRPSGTPGLRAAVLLRAPGAAFFFVLLGRELPGLSREVAAPLVAWALAFAPPYLALLRGSVSLGPKSTPERQQNR